MEVFFQNAKNGELTVSIDGFFFHSSYSPQKEAQRFVENLKFPFSPEIIFITEPGISYCADFFRQKFPSSKLVVIRYLTDFKQFDNKFDFVIDFFSFNNNSHAFEKFLSSHFCDSEILCSVFCSWNATSKCFPDFEKSFWQSIKNVTQKARTVLITSQFFEKKWFLNSISFFNFLKTSVSLQKKISNDILIIASGPSLLPVLSLIQKNQNSFFIIVLSSAIKCCFENNIIPDLCFSTDGGYWAKEHLKILEKYPDAVLALSSESCCQKSILHKNPVLPLIYEDGISKDLSIVSGIDFYNAKRNGTVSGTALQFAMEYSTGNIYFSGLDLHSQKGFQHTNPNELQINSQISDFKLSSAEKKQVSAMLNSDSLKVYEDWFCNFDIQNKKVFRIIEKKDRNNSLGKIQDISINEFEKLIPQNKIEKNFVNYFIRQNKRINLEKIKKFIEKNFFDENIKKQFYPLDFVQYSHSKNSEIIYNINEKHKKLFDKADSLFPNF